MNKIIFTVLIFFIGGFISYLMFGNQDITFENLNAEEIYEKIIKEK